MNRKAVLFNDVVEMLGAMDVGFQDEKTSLDFVLTLTNIVWYLSPFYPDFVNRSAHIPQELMKFNNVRDHRDMHIRKPMVSILYDPFFDIAY